MTPIVSGSRKKRLAAFLCAVLMLLLLSPPVTVLGDEGATPLTLEDAVRTALSQNPYIAAAGAMKNASDERLTQARSGFLPQLDFSQGYSRTTNPMWAFGTRLNQAAITAPDFDPDRLNDPDAIDNFASRFSVTWPLFDSGQTWFGARQARLGTELGALQLSRARQEVVARAVKAYLGVLLSMEQARVVEKAIETALLHQKTIRDRHAEGMAVKSDLLRDEVHVAGLEQKRIQARSQEAVSRSMLNAAMGVPETSLYRLDTPLRPESVQEQAVETWIQTALNRRPDYEELTLQRDILAAEVKKARAKHLPSLSLVGNYELDSEELTDFADNYMVGVMVNLNLFSGNRTSAGVRESEARLSAVEANLDGMKQQVQVETRRAFLDARNARQRIEVSESAMALAEAHLDIVASRYHSGLVTLVELLDAETALQQARTNRLNAVHDHRTAMVDLRLAAGVLEETFQVAQKAP